MEFLGKFDSINLKKNINRFKNQLQHLEQWTV